MDLKEIRKEIDATDDEILRMCVHRKNIFVLEITKGDKICR